MFNHFEICLASFEGPRKQQAILVCYAKIRKALARIINSADSLNDITKGQFFHLVSPLSQKLIVSVVSVVLVSWAGVPFRQASS